MELVQKIFRIDGMTCINCQNKIEQGLRGLSGVQEASVSYRTGTAQVTYDPTLVTIHQIKEKIKKLGYEVLPDGQAEGPDMIRVVCLLAIIIALYVLLQQFGILNLLVPRQLADSSMGYGMLFVVGLFTSVHCIAMCGGINLSQCLPGKESRDGLPAYVFLPSFLYNAGRVASYTIIGFLLGGIGSVFGGGSGTGISVLAQGILKLIAGTVMVVMGINMLGIFPWLRRWTPHMPNWIVRKIGIQKATTRRPFAVGLLNGLMPCGPLQSMQILALASGNPLSGALSMLLFSLGTVPLMLGLGAVVSSLGRRFAHTVEQAGAVLVAVLGMAMLSQGGSLTGMLPPDRLLFLVIALAVIGAAVSVPVERTRYRAAIVTLSAVLIFAVGAVWPQFTQKDSGVGSSTVRIADGIQLVESTLAAGQYPTIMVQAGLPVQWTIHAPEGSVNGCNYRAIIQAFGIEHSFVEGDNMIEFTPTEAGTIAYTCWMGMIQGSIIVTE